ncbi:hypothetical protein NO559_07740 [Dasania sp. GY-MA-18]|uniref:Uncharacterized protein n=1 Tax=Dasania phycosphaerae TaxID=2950436 RepID=A0A9J6RLK6_9GAMM|nr:MULTISPECIES: hypothetical protein [Dasania]MCR8922658.1 hypothetical protein [Dasania sp. GY-MA-18]MCZ0865088.1 hypothetical protein [Dasania phycosphaerae]MCZ0868814.1 hypothetical protein [Dasania phycosphaerae]
MKARIAHNTPELANTFGNVRAAIAKHVDAKLARGVLEVANLAKQLAPKAESTLTNAIHPEHLGPSLYEVVSPVTHATAVEKGTGPGGFAPLQSILDWMKVKGIHSDTPESVAFLIQRKILRHGTPAQPHMEPALEQKKSRLQELAAQGIAAGFREAAHGR